MLPSTRLSFEPLEIRTPFPALPEMMLRAPGVVPPIVFCPRSSISTPLPLLPKTAYAGDVGADVVALHQIA